MFKALFIFCLFSLTIYGTVELYGGNIVTHFLKGRTEPFVISVDDLDLGILAGSVTAKDIKIKRGTGFELGDLKTFSFSPRWRGKSLYFESIDLTDGDFRVSASDIPENAEEKTRPLPIKPRFDKITLNRLTMTALGVPGIEGDKNLTLRHINGKINCLGEILCLNNEFAIKAEPMKGSVASISGRADVRKVKEFDVRSSLKDVRVSAFNAILPTNSPVVAKSGKIDLYTEIKLRGLAGQGYMKFFAKNISLKKNEKAELGGLTSLVANYVDDKKVEYFDLKLPVSFQKNSFSTAKSDVKAELQRLLRGEKLHPGFDSRMQAQTE
jgi:hypothetical protein